jgi:hypothetical protein
MTVKRIAWYLSQVAAIVVAVLLFFSWIPWIASEPIAEVAPEVAAQLPINCPAVFTNHGQHSCFWPGRVRDHMGTFIALTAGLATCSGFLSFVSLTGRGFSFGKRKEKKQ